MSTTIMAACWPLQMDSSAKSVLISLADNANDGGWCWPALDTIARRTCLSRRTVIDAIQRLEAGGHLQADRTTGRATKYRVLHGTEVFTNPCNSRTGAADAPVRQVHDTRANAALDPCSSRTLTVKNHQEPSLEKNTRARRASAVERPEGVTEQTWQDFLAIRRAKRAPITVTALAGIEREAQKAGLTLQAGLQVCAERGWQSLKAEWLEPDRPAATGSSKRDQQRSRDAEFFAALTGRKSRLPKPEVIDV